MTRKTITLNAPLIILSVKRVVANYEPTKENTNRECEGDCGCSCHVVDRFVATPEEKEAIRQSIESEITKRWEADSLTDSWLSKNVRPLTLATVMIFLVLMTFFEGFGISSINERWIGLWKW